ncbi:uncharacterized protein LOC111401126 [Olea europaea var. sylvestris]|uniref:uncharacterized protein LOC111401126 n=1 Tax=Olea europaea var. sylvestris TaxID=158386 RepID=UPI000C1D7DC2|nr:uncharacterized protein LOC111401126 [Olea europaea var. sylvestris]
MIIESHVLQLYCLNRKRLRKEENLSANDIQQQRVPLGATTGSRPSPKRLVFISPLLLYCQMMNTSEMLHPTRRENARGESACCNNVRALCDELPTPHLIIEISPFPAGPLSDNDYAKAEKLESSQIQSYCLSVFWIATVCMCLLNENDYSKAEKLERMFTSGPE